MNFKKEILLCIICWILRILHFLFYDFESSLVSSCQPVVSVSVRDLFRMRAIAFNYRLALKHSLLNQLHTYCRIWQKRLQDLLKALVIFFLAHPRDTTQTRDCCVIRNGRKILDKENLLGHRMIKFDWKILIDVIKRGVKYPLFLNVLFYLFIHVPTRINRNKSHLLFLCVYISSGNSVISDHKEVAW